MNWKVGNEVEGNTEMKASEGDQRYIYMPNIPSYTLYIHTPSSSVNFTDICKFKMTFAIDAIFVLFS